jgi:hypothetical protein
MKKNGVRMDMDGKRSLFFENFECSGISNEPFLSLEQFLSMSTHNRFQRALSSLFPGFDVTRSSPSK